MTSMSMTIAALFALPPCPLPDAGTGLTGRGRVPIAGPNILRCSHQDRRLIGSTNQPGREGHRHA